MITHEPKQSSYRTYEEWKQPAYRFSLSVTFCSYRTYEEWKQHMITQYIFLFNFGSYRTYEEWKLPHKYK